MDSILRIDMGTAGGPSAALEHAGRYQGLAGRAVASLVVADEVDPSTHPLGAGNKLVVAPGDAGAVSVGCKSPLDGGIVASRADGPAAEALRHLGYAAVVVEGQASGDDLWTVVVDARGVVFAADNGCRMLGNLETVARLRRAHGTGAALLSIGPAGEMGLGAASLTCTGGGPRAIRHCGLGGAGAVMASKHLKAIVVRADAAGERGLPGGPDPDPAPGSPFRDACGIRDPLVLGQLEALVDDLGLDAGEVAAAVSLAMEAGLAHTGDGQAALRLVEEIARGTPLGRIVGSGVRAMADTFGLERRREGAAWRGDAGALVAAVAVAGPGPAARDVLEVERRFRARARAAAAEHAAGEAEPGVSAHPIVFGAIDDDLARLFGVLDTDADPFDPQLQLPIGLRPSHAAGPGRPVLATRTDRSRSRGN
jgi:aldehyde:ferredoxin oxidoreductase